jgi:hypothetical protein
MLFVGFKGLKVGNIIKKKVTVRVWKRFCCLDWLYRFHKKDSLWGMLQLKITRSGQTTKHSATSAPVGRSSSRLGQAYQINGDACVFRGDVRPFSRRRRDIQPSEPGKVNNHL